MSRNENIDDRLTYKFQDLEEQFRRVSNKSVPYIKEITSGFNDGRDKLLAENRSLLESLKELDELLERTNSDEEDLLKQVYAIRDQVLNYNITDSTKMKGPFYDFIVKNLIADPRNVVTINRLFGNGAALVSYFTFFLTELDNYRHPNHVCEAIFELFKWNSQDITRHGIDFLSKSGAHITAYNRLNATTVSYTIKFEHDDMWHFERYLNNNILLVENELAIDGPVFVAVYIACCLIRWADDFLHAYNMHFERRRGTFEYSIWGRYNSGVGKDGSTYVRRDAKDVRVPPPRRRTVPPRLPNYLNENTKYKRVSQNIPVQSRIPAQQSRPVPKPAAPAKATIKKLKPVVYPRIMWEEIAGPLPDETPETINRSIADLHKFLQSGFQRESTRLDLAMLDAIYRQRRERAASIPGLRERNEAIFKVNLEYFYNMRKLNS